MVSSSSVVVLYCLSVVVGSSVVVVVGSSVVFVGSSVVGVFSVVVLCSFSVVCDDMQVVEALRHAEVFGRVQSIAELVTNCLLVKAIGRGIDLG